MQDWCRYIEKPYQEVLEELRAEGYQVVGDDLIACYRNVDLQKGDARIRLVCVPFDLDDFDEDVTIDVEGNKHFGNDLCPETDDWDFYWDNDHILPNVKGQVRSVKMWRKDDFDRLVEKAKKLGIVVETKE